MKYTIEMLRLSDGTLPTMLHRSTLQAVQLTNAAHGIKRIGLEDGTAVAMALFEECPINNPERNDYCGKSENQDITNIVAGNTGARLGGRYDWTVRRPFIQVISHGLNITWRVIGFEQRVKRTVCSLSDLSAPQPVPFEK